MKFEIFLGVVAGILHIIAFGIYNRNMLAKDSHPNVSTWTLWVFLSGFNCITYIFMSKDWVKGLLPFASSVACIATFFVALIKGRLSKLDEWEDAVAMIVGFISIFVWWQTKSATYANLILQFSIAISFIPTYRGVWKDPLKEKKTLPWFMWASAYILLMAVVVLRWKGQYQDFAYPINGLIMHSGVGILALRKIS